MTERRASLLLELAVSTSAVKCSVGLVIYRTPVAELLSLFVLLAADGSVAQVLVYDNWGDAELRFEVERRGWSYQCGGKNIGFGAAHNRLLTKVNPVQCPYHLLLNPDIIWARSPLPGLLRYLESNPDCAAIMPDVRNPDGSRQYLAKRLPTPLILIGRRFLPKFSWLKRRIAHYEMRDEMFDVPMQVPLISGCCMLTRCDVLLRVGGFDERFFLYLEDYDLCRRFAEAGFSLLMNPQETVIHGHGRASYRWNRTLLWHLSSAIKYFNRWGWW